MFLKDGGSNIFKTWWEYSRSREYSYLCVEFTNDGYFLHTIVYHLVLSCTMVYYGVLWCTVVYYDVLSCTIMHYFVLSCTMVGVVPSFISFVRLEVCAQRHMSSGRWEC